MDLFTGLALCVLPGPLAARPSVLAVTRWTYSSTQAGRMRRLRPGATGALSGSGGELGGDGFGHRDGNASRVRRVPASMGCPVDAWRASAGLRAWATSAGGRLGGAEGRAAGSCTGSVTSSRTGCGSGSTGAGSGRCGSGACGRRLPPRKASAGQPATRTRSQSGTSLRSSSPAVATFALSDAASATANQDQAARLGASVPRKLRSRRHAATRSRSTETGQAHAFQPSYPAASARSCR